MPRRSAADLAIIRSESSATLLQPPADMSEPERQAFKAIVANCSPDHFRLSDLELLCRYVEAVGLAQQAAKELRNGAVIDNRVSPWIIVQEKVVRALVSLSLRLRLGPQARISSKSLGRQQLPIAGLPVWHRGNDDDSDAD